MPQSMAISRLLDGFSKRGASLLRRYGFSDTHDGRDAIARIGMEALARAVLSVRGEASGVALATDLLAAYAAADSEDRAAFLQVLNDQFAPDETALDQAWAAWRTHGAAALAGLTRAAEPPRQELLRRLNLAPGGTAALVAMRADLLAMAGGSDRFAALDGDFVHLFASWFNRGFLHMEEIGWDSPARLLERVIRYEAVHDIRDWDDLRQRLDPSDRRCFGFFHPSLPGEPLIFVEVALTRGLADSIQSILAGDREPMAAEAADTAILYSISNCQAGLKGIGFGHFLIKQVASDLKRSLPNLQRFATLSPVPGFRRWLEREADSALTARLAEPGWPRDGGEDCRDALMAHALRYFTHARTDAGKPVDPVARFHIGNGARLERINWLGDRSPAGLRQSAGIMVNYLYDLDQIEEIHEAYVHQGTVAIGPLIEAMAAGPKAQKPKRRERHAS